jgi:hypothetical protein
MVILLMFEGSVFEARRRPDSNTLPVARVFPRELHSTSSAFDAKNSTAYLSAVYGAEAARTFSET